MDRVEVGSWSRDPSWLLLRTQGNFQSNLERCRAVPGRRWVKEEKAWVAPATTGALEAVLDLWRGHEVALQDGRVEELREHLEAERDARRQRDQDTEPEPVPGAITPPWRHQARAFHFALAHAGTMLHMGLGTGKSKVVVDLVNQRTFRRVLILCPKSVCGVWVRQFATHGNGDQVLLSFHLASPTTAQQRMKATWMLTHAAAEDRPFVLVLNYESARAGFQTARQVRPNSLPEWLLGLSWDLVVLDESHRVKDYKGVTGRLAAALAQHARKRLCLTGTPMPHDPLDVWAQFRFLDVGVFGSSYTTFRAHYGVMGGYLNKQVVGFKNQQELAERMARCTFSARTDDVLELPPFVDVDRDFTLSEKEKTTYKKVEQDFIAHVRDGTIVASNALTRLLRLQQIVSGHVTVEPDDGRPKFVERLGDSREALLADILEDLAPDEPVAVFCHFHADLDAVWRVANKLERQYCELSGRRHDLNEGKWTEGQILGVQTQAGGVGVDLTRARYCVFYSLGYSLGDYEQARARVRRPGQTRPVTYLHVMARGTIDEVVRDALNKKRDVVEHVLSHCRGPARFSLTPASQGGVQ